MLMLTPYYSVVFAYHDHGSGPHTVTLSLFQIQVLQIKIQSKNYIVKYRLMQIQKLKLVQMQIPATVIRLWHVTTCYTTHNVEFLAALEE